MMIFDRLLAIRDSDYRINLLLDKANYEEQIKSNYWVESAQLVYPISNQVYNQGYGYDIVALLCFLEESHYPILSSGQLETSSVSLVSLPENLYIRFFFNDSEQIKTFTSELSQISPELQMGYPKGRTSPKQGSHQI